MAKRDQSNTLSPFQRFEKLAKALFAVPKKEIEIDSKTSRVRRKRAAKKRTA
jgi:hypothetical protein